MLAITAAGSALQAAEKRAIELDDLWEDTPVTKDVVQRFRIYKRRQMPSRLHEQLRLDVFHWPDWRPSDQRPVVMFIHGGGWGAGNPDQWFPQCRYFALRGLIAASVQYRLKGGSNTVATCLADCKSAVRYLRRHATELGVDANKIVVVGESAGGHLAAALGTIEGHNDLLDDLTVSARPNVLILLNPITDLKTRWGEGMGDFATTLSPLHHISMQTPPTLLVHGDADSVVNIQHSRAFHQRMQELGLPTQLVVLPGADHAFAIMKYGPDQWVRRTIIEMDRYLQQRGYLKGECLMRESP